MAKKHEKDEPLSFIMFQNDKEKETQPDFTGKFITQDGKVMRIAGWKRGYQDRDGNHKELVAGKVSEFQNPNTKNEQNQQKELVNDSDDLPF